MKTARYVALLRGINVGGKNIIRMSALQQCFEEMGFTDVVTYIQSGNVLFSASGNKQPSLTALIEKTLSKRFRYTSRVVVMSHAELKRVVAGAPQGFGSNRDRFRYDVIFLIPPVTAGTALTSVQVRAGVDTAHAGRGVLYFSRLIKRASQSYLTKLVQQPVYQHMTIRNWNTTTKLLQLFQAEHP